MLFLENVARRPAVTAALLSATLASLMMKAVWEADSNAAVAAGTLATAGGRNKNRATLQWQPASSSSRSSS